MQVRFKVAVVGPDICIGVGEVIDLSLPDAEYWIKIDYAEKVESKPKPKRVTVQKVRQKETR